MFSNKCSSTALTQLAFQMRIIFITLECADPVFSGNGTYSRSLINSLLRNSNVQVFVVTASPIVESETPFPADWLASSSFHYRVIKVPSEKWNRHDINSSWEEFANGFDSNLVENLHKFNPDIIAGVDWSALRPYQILSKTLRSTPYVYLNFRVFHASSGIPEKDKSIYKEMERDSCASAIQTITLSPADTTSLINLTKLSNISTLLPPLPQKIHNLATAYTPSFSPLTSSPKYLLCCVRLSPEKNVEVFVEVCASLSAFLTEQNIIPYLCGAAQTKEYAEKLRKKLREVHPASVIIEEVLSHDALVEVYKQTILNFHPALYEAYGLTIVEAAAFGVPSIVNQGGDIGATALLLPTQGANEVFTTDMENAAKVSQEVQAVLSPSNSADRVVVASRARAKSLSYGEQENGERFLEHLKEIRK